jgi:1-acyl-sn-glycerol-3-phosphate acyltransferase
VVGLLLRSAGFISVRRGTTGAAEALAPARQALQQGECVLVYPEGTITLDPDTWPMRGRPGAVKMALDAGVPLVPMAQWGAQTLLPRRSKFPRLLPRPRFEVRVGPAIDLSDLAAWPDQNAAARAGTERLMAKITELLADIRGETPPNEPFNQFTKGAK